MSISIQLTTFAFSSLQPYLPYLVCSTMKFAGQFTLFFLGLMTLDGYASAQDVGSAIRSVAQQIPSDAGAAWNSVAGAVGSVIATGTADGASIGASVTSAIGSEATKVASKVEQGSHPP
ncbi:hypothetical protein K493DRAFT_407110 [Basidiobolus meristosporus CBS 931.73]|uniref:Uncharacterized protein n=1 Tax=Basidiobolus meristosporus CBS 931.73 TaxID=1314790 RepID=A0A1Y1YFL0_9FUNG|nr:hypothetical protein K493DRAFT_407110 [Basidiobolus meristosporus CBS 931.73]|eukprot:ORX96821.1 hypothetical protein K493DRAFT_407110 [Basidiobolus meristosporus CBS 931.73]